MYDAERHAKTQKKFDEIKNLKAGWDGYSAPPFNEGTIFAARAVANTLIHGGYDVSVTPTSGEAILIEWKQGEYECSAEISADKLST